MSNFSDAERIFNRKPGFLGLPWALEAQLLQVMLVDLSRKKHSLPKQRKLDVGMKSKALITSQKLFQTSRTLVPSLLGWSLAMGISNSI